jgi:hypothetical protein
MSAYGCSSSWGTPTHYLNLNLNYTTTILGHHWLGCWPLMSETTEYSKQEMFPSLALLSHNRLQNAMAQCHIQWLYLAVHGCKTYLNLNLSWAANQTKR